MFQTPDLKNLLASPEETDLIQPFSTYDDIKKKK
jgi:hypothetical protein